MRQKNYTDLQKFVKGYRRFFSLARIGDFLAAAATIPKEVTAPELTRAAPAEEIPGVQ